MFKKIIKNIFIFLVAAVALLMIIDTIQMNPRAIAQRIMKRGNFETNELRIIVKLFKILPVGIASLKNLGIEKFEDRIDAYHLVAEASSLPFLSSVFIAKAKAESFVDAKELHPLLFLEHSEISNNASEDKKIIYDQDKNIMKIRNEERKIFPHSQDPLSVMFYIQHQEFAIGKSITLYLNTNQKNYDLDYQITSREDFTSGEKKYTLWQLEGNVKRHDKSPRHSVRLKIWFLESLKDNKKIPVLIKVMTNMGPITAYATEVK